MTSRGRKIARRTIIAIASILVASALWLGYVMEHFHTDRSRPNIFELEGANQGYSPDLPQEEPHSFWSTSFMIQRVPHSQEELRDMVAEFIESNDLVLDSYLGSQYFDFYIPSIGFPANTVNDERKPDWLYYHVTHYPNNRFLRVVFEYGADEGEYMFIRRKMPFWAYWQWWS